MQELRQKAEKNIKLFEHCDKHALFSPLPYILRVFPFGSQQRISKTLEQPQEEGCNHKQITHWYDGEVLEPWTIETVGTRSADMGDTHIPSTQKLSPFEKRNLSVFGFLNFSICEMREY